MESAMDSDPDSRPRRVVRVKEEPQCEYTEQVFIEIEVQPVTCETEFVSVKEEREWGNSASASESEAAPADKQPDSAATDRMHVKEEVLEFLEEEAAWEHSFASGSGSAAALADLYAGQEVKDMATAAVGIVNPRGPGSTGGGLGETRGRWRRWSPEEHRCQTCNKTFTTQSNLTNHERIHTGERPFSCGTCNKKFTELGSLKRHERTHTGERPYSCGTCNKKFTDLGGLKRHERTHTGERPYSCRTCNKKFTELGSLKKHERTHTGERFACRTCNKKFTQLINLKTHERIHTGERPFFCGICKKKFTTSSHLKNHERIHTGERPFSCQTCNKKFKRSSNLRAHERTHKGVS